MSSRKVVAAKAAAKPAGKPAPARRTNAGKAVAPQPTEPAPGATSDISAAAEKVAADIGHALADGRADLLTAEAIQALMAAACRSYSARVEAMGDFPPLTARSLVTSTDVMVTASGLLKSANLAVFELGMWQSWTGR
jgi:hypothetical protein